MTSPPTGGTSPFTLDVEAELRREWWANHGHDYHALYGDDGEMQCGACPADFKRDPLERLQQLVLKARLERGARVLREQNAEGSSA